MLLVNKFEINLKAVKLFKTPLFYRNNIFNLEVKIRTLNATFGGASKIIFEIACLFQVFRNKSRENVLLTAKILKKLCFILIFI